MRYKMFYARFQRHLLVFLLLSVIAKRKLYVETRCEIMDFAMHATLLELRTTSAIITSPAKDC
jgi:hypothetical protein